VAVNLLDRGAVAAPFEDQQRLSEAAGAVEARRQRGAVGEAAGPAGLRALGVEDREALVAVAGDADDEVVGTPRAGAAAARDQRQRDHAWMPIATGQQAQRLAGERVRAALGIDQAKIVADLGDGEAVGAHGDHVGDRGDGVDARKRRRLGRPRGCGRRRQDGPRRRCAQQRDHGSTRAGLHGRRG
jgi:hypothetical protein